VLFLVLQANYFEKISLILIFSLVNPNAPGLSVVGGFCSECFIIVGWTSGGHLASNNHIHFFHYFPAVMLA